MRRSKYATLLGGVAFAILIISACATDNKFRPTGASRADGIVQLSYDYVLSDRPVLDWVSAQNTAEERCASWGYAGAQKFGAGGANPALRFGQAGGRSAGPINTHFPDRSSFLPVSTPIPL